MHLQGFKNNGGTPWNNDCTVRALASATRTDYMKVFLTLQAAGRRNNSGFDIYGWLKRNKYCVFGHQFDPVSRIGLIGTYLCGGHSHVWTIINGVMHDSHGGSRRPKFVYFVHKLAENEAQPTGHERASATLYDAMAQD